ncbi:conjugal transfer protein TraO [Proteus mirabilis]
MSTKSQSIKKIAIIGTAVVVTGVVVGSLFVFSDDPASKRIEQSKIVNKQTRPDNNSDNKDESYKLLLQEYNDINSQKALDTGTSYIGVPVNEKVDESTNTEKKYDWEKPTQNKPTNNNVQSSNNDRQREEVLKRKLALLTKIEDKRGATSENNAIFASASYGSVSGEGQNEWATSLFPEKNQENNINNSEITQKKVGEIIVQGLSLFPSKVETRVDSDSQNMKMLATVKAGKLNGARLYSKDMALAGDGIQVHFSEMQWNGKYYKIDAYAVNANTNEFAVATTVSNRYFSRILLPALAFGIGKTGQLYKDSNSNVIVTPNGGEYRSQGSPNGEAIAGTIIGGIGEQTGKVMAEDASKIPPKQAILERNEIIGVQFINPVYTSDIIEK